MTSKLNMHDSVAETLSHMPAWVTSARAQGPEDVAFLSGAALATLQLVLGRQVIASKPQCGSPVFLPCR
jgi:hypothetical protein